MKYLIFVFSMINSIELTYPFSQTESPLIAILNESPLRNTDFYPDCWSENGTFLSDTCTVEEEKCSIEKNFTQGNLHYLTVSTVDKNASPPGEDLYVSVPGVNEWSNNVQKFGNQPWKTSVKAPEGAIATVYSRSFINRVNSFNIYSRMKVPSDGDIKINDPIIAHQDFSLEQGKGWPPDLKLDASLFGKYFASIYSGSSINFKLAEGKYILKLKVFYSNKSYEYDLILNVDKIVKPKLFLRIDFDKFKEVIPVDSRYKPLSWHDDRLGFGKYSNNLKILYGFEEVSLIELAHNKKNITDLFEIKKGQLVLKNRSQFDNEIENNPFYKLKITGKCATYIKREKLKTYNVLNNEDKPLGVLYVFIENEKFKALFKKTETQELLPFKSNLKTKFDGFFYQGLSRRENLIDLGSGPWGEEGWIDAPIVSLLKDRVFYFQGEKPEDYVEYFRRGNGKIYKRIVSTKNLKKDSFYEGEKFLADSKEFLNSEGMVKEEIVEMLKFGRESRDFPFLVDLSNNKILLTGGKSTEAFLYSGASEDSSKLGKLNFIVKDNKLSGTYLHFKSKKEFPIISDFYQGRCGNSFFYSSLQNVLDVAGDFSKIGSGPWGEYAWVNVKRFAINEKEIPIEFKLSDGSYKIQNFYIDNENKIAVSGLIGVKNRNQSRSDISFIENEIFENGKLKLLPHCDEVKAINFSKNYGPKYIKMDSIKNGTIVYSRPSQESEKLGTITSKYEHSLLEFSFNSQNQNNSKKFKPNWYANFCDPLEKFLYAHQIVEHENNWSNLGEGPWGEEAWIEIQSESIFDSNLRFQFNGIYGDVRFEKLGDYKFKMHSLDEYEALDDRVVNMHDILSSDGTVKLELMCSFGH